LIEYVGGTWAVIDNSTWICPKFPRPPLVFTPQSYPPGWGGSDTVRDVWFASNYGTPAGSAGAHTVNTKASLLRGTSGIGIILVLVLVLAAAAVMVVFPVIPLAGAVMPVGLDVSSGGMKILCQVLFLTEV